MRLFRSALLLAGLALAGYIAFRLLVVTDSRRIAQVMENVRLGIIQRDVNRVMAGIDRTYQDDYGQDYGRLRRFFEAQFRVHDSIFCAFPRLRVLVNHEEATCSLTFWGVGYQKSGSGGESEPDVFGGYPPYRDQIVVYLYKYQTGWRIVGAGP
jgi:hypothetical protein